MHSPTRCWTWKWLPSRESKPQTRGQNRVKGLGFLGLVVQGLGISQPAGFAYGVMRVDLAQDLCIELGGISTTSWNSAAKVLVFQWLPGGPFTNVEPQVRNWIIPSAKNIVTHNPRPCSDCTCSRRIVASSKLQVFNARNTSRFNASWQTIPNPCVSPETSPRGVCCSRKGQH